MKNFNYLFLLAFASLLLFSSCGSEDEPTPLELAFADLNFTIDENPTAGQEIATAKAVVNRGDIAYALSNQSPTGAMKIDAKTGKLTVANASVFDFETNPTITATASATVEGVSKTATITVTVNDLDETVPTVITISDFNTTIDENQSSGTSLGTVTATVNQGSLNFAITSQAPTGAIAIDANTGELTVADASQFDFETNPTLTATVEATANGETKSATATVTLNDVNESNDFVTTWRTTTANETITIPTGGSGYNYSVDWGDGGSGNNITGNVSYVYASAGIHTITISGDFPTIVFSGDGFAMRPKIISIENWGNINWTTFQNSFSGCSNLTYNAADAPNLANVINMSWMFADATSFDGNLNNWDVSNVRSMSYMFRNASSFNGDISSWDTEDLSTMQSMFEGATSFNSNIGGWKTGKITQMGSVFDGATKFNQPIGNWDVSQCQGFNNMFEDASAFNQDLNNWDVSKVRTFSGIFRNASAFNGDISGWQTGELTTMFAAFFGASSFNQDIGGWDVADVSDFRWVLRDATSFNHSIGNWDISSATRTSTMIENSGLSVANYDATLKGWSELSTAPSDIRLDANGLKYCAVGETARTTLMNNKNWTFSGDSKGSTSECQ